MLNMIGLPWVLENVEGAPLVDPLVLCGTMFPGLRVIRHRRFELSWGARDGRGPRYPALAGLDTWPGYHPGHPLVYTRDKRKSHYGKLDEMTAFVQVTGGGNCSVKAARDAMGIGWMTKAELNEAIPPAYTEWIGRQLMAALEVAA